MNLKRVLGSLLAALALAWPAALRAQSDFDAPAAESRAGLGLSAPAPFARTSQDMGRFTTDQLTSRALVYALWTVRLQAQRTKSLEQSAQGEALTSVRMVQQTGTELQSALLDAARLTSSAQPDVIEKAAALERVRATYENWEAASRNPAYQALDPDTSLPSPSLSRIRRPLAELEAQLDKGGSLEQQQQAASDAFSGEAQTGPLKTPAEMEPVWATMAPQAAATAKAAYERAYRETYLDSGTGIRNRKFLDHHAEQLTQSPHHQLMGDVDHFKSVNDDPANGHLVGDKVLRAVARIWGEELAKAGEVGVRWGGEEFWGMVSGGREAALEVARRIKDRIQAEVQPAAKLNRPITISIGVAEAVREPKATPQEHFLATLHNADKALYRAKDAGRNKVVIALDREFHSYEMGKLTPLPEIEAASEAPPAPELVESSSPSSVFARCLAYLRSFSNRF